MVVGAGHAGEALACLLRQQSSEINVVMIGDETHAPYHRPPLSKSIFNAGAADLHRPLRTDAFYVEQRITLLRGRRVSSIDRREQTVCLDDGTSQPYDALVLATGARARVPDLPGAGLRGVHLLRTLDHATALHGDVRPGDKLVVLGGGWIGLEVAAAARAAGVAVTVLERESRLVARVASEALSARLARLHDELGTQVRTSVEVSGLVSGSDGRVTAVRLVDGTTIACDAVLLSAGAEPVDDLARHAGLSCDGGILVDERGVTSDPAVLAIGDVTRRPVATSGGRIRLESIPSASEQARRAASHLLAHPDPGDEVPWFWSDQGPSAIQIAGLLPPGANAVVRREPSGGEAVFHLVGDLVVAVEAVDLPAAFTLGKRWIRAGTAVDPVLLGDPGVPLSSVAVVPVDVPEDVVEAPKASRSDSQPAVLTAGPLAPGRPRVTYVQQDGSRSTIEVSTGTSVMDGSLRANLPGIIGECGGMATCGTCHVLVGQPWRDHLVEPEYEEEELLEFLEGSEPGSRLACQIVVGDELDGLVAEVRAVRR